MSNEEKIKQLEQQVIDLKEKTKILEDIIGILPGHIYWKDRNGLLMGCNDEQAKSAGLAHRDQIKGLRPIDLIDKGQPPIERKKEADAISSVDKYVMENNKPITTEETAKQPDGSIHTFISKKVPIHDKDGHVVGLAGSTLDITKQKQLAKELEDANKFKTNIMEASDKILRTPVNAIIAMAQVLELESKLSEKDKSYVEIIHEAANSIPPLLARFGLYSAVEHSDYYFQKEQFDLVTLVKDIIISQNYVVNKREKVVNLITNNIPTHISASSVAFSEVFTTLIRTIIRYNTGKSLDIDLKYNDENAVDVIMQFENAAIAKISSDQLFNLIDNISNTLLIDVALELSIVAKIVSILKGNITIDSRDAQVKLLLTLPIKAIDKERISEKIAYQGQEAIEQKKSIKTLKDKPPLHALLVEDDLFCQTALACLLKNIANVTVETASSVAEARAHLSKTDFDVIFLDINLPDDTGETIIQDVRKEDAHLPVIVVTSTANEEFREQLISQYGATDVILKPALAADIVQQLEAYVYEEG